jgi:hypothetical protein
MASFAEELDSMGSGLQVALLHALDQGRAMALFAVVLENLQLDRVVCGEQVTQFFVVQFDEGTLDRVFGFVGLETVEEGVENARDDTSRIWEWENVGNVTGHGVGFSSTGLAVRENGAVEAIQDLRGC